MGEERGQPRAYPEYTCGQRTRLKESEATSPAALDARVKADIRQRLFSCEYNMFATIQSTGNNTIVGTAIPFLKRNHRATAFSNLTPGTTSRALVSYRLFYEIQKRKN